MQLLISYISILICTSALIGCSFVGGNLNIDEIKVDHIRGSIVKNNRYSENRLTNFKLSLNRPEFPRHSVVSQNSSFHIPLATHHYCFRDDELNYRTAQYN